MTEIIIPKNDEISPRQTQKRIQSRQSTLITPLIRSVTISRSSSSTSSPTSNSPSTSTSTSTSSFAIVTAPTQVRTSMSSAARNIKKEVKTVTITTWTCIYCKKAKFSCPKVATRHEELCLKDQIHKLNSCRSLLESINFTGKKQHDENEGGNDDNDHLILDILRKLDSFHHMISIHVLESTQIGATVNKLRKCQVHSVATKAKELVNSWKAIVSQEKKMIKKKNKGSTSNPKTTSGTHGEIKRCRSIEEEEQKSKRQKKKTPKATATAPIFQRARKQQTMTADKKFLTKKNSKTTNPTQPLASIFSRQYSKSKSNSVPSEIDDNSVPAAASSSLTFSADTNTNTNTSHDQSLTFIDVSNKEFQLANESLLSEHRKAEYLIKRRRIEEQRQVTKKKQHNADSENIISSSSNKDGRKRKGAGIASIFQPVAVISNSLEKNVLIKTSVISENSTVDLTTTDKRPVQDLQKSIIARKTKGREQLMEARMHYLRNSAPCFPIPNHIVGTIGIDTYIKSSSSHLVFFSSQVRNSLIRTPKHQCGFDNMFSNIETCIHEDFVFEDLYQQQVKRSTPDPLHSCLSTVLQPATNNCAGPQLWSNKYAMSAIPNDIYGEENKKAAGDLLSFISDWKEHRQQVITAAEQAHRRRNGKKRKKKPTPRNNKRYDYDDDFMSDSEDEDGLCKVYILCGPVGCGKTSMAYAVAKKSQCVLLEINTTDDRGGVSLKKAIEECTQSHSSLALLKGKNTFFCDNADFQDTDDEEEANMPSLAIILIDEVDLLFESDVGFWPSLNNLAKKAKCPIILTAAAPPPQLLNSSSITYRYAYLTRPSPMECASKMCQIAKMENMKWKNTEHGPSVKERLSTVAKICDCDLRRIMNEMQLFNNGSAYIDSNTFLNESKKDEADHSINSTRNYPTIDSIYPKRVSALTHNVIQIRGKYFFGKGSFFEKGLSVDVTVGEHLCPAIQIINDHTILAVCPPCILPNTVTTSGMIKGSLFQRSLDTGYQHVVVKFNDTNGMVYRSDSSLNDCGSPLLCYEFPQENTESEICVKLIKETDKEINELLKDAADTFYAIDGQKDANELVSASCASITNTEEKNAVDDNREMIRLMQAAASASDAALLEDGIRNMSMPLLAGAICSFGEGIDNDSSISSRNTFGDKLLVGSDVYMTRPTTQRERYLNSAACEFSRGLASFHPEIGINNTSTNNHPMLGEDDDCLFQSEATSSISDEDLFLPRPINMCATMIPTLVRESRQFQDGGFHELVFDEQLLLLKSEKNAKIKNVQELVHPVLPLSSNLISLSKGCNKRFVDNFISRSVSLDYVPTLRNMAVIERKAFERFNKLVSSDDADFTRQSRRRTRRGRQLEREHYFQHLIETHCENEAKELGENLAGMKLTISN